MASWYKGRELRPELVSTPGNPDGKGEQNAICKTVVDGRRRRGAGGIAGSGDCPEGGAWRGGYTCACGEYDSHRDTSRAGAGGCRPVSKYRFVVLCFYFQRRLLFPGPSDRKDAHRRVRFHLE